VHKQILITGGAGFIGSHVADELLSCGYRVRAVDNLSSQVHGSERKKPTYLSSEVELLSGDIRNTDFIRRALIGVDAVFHLAAMVGVGQSMYRICDYTSVNDVGTAALLEAIIEHPVERLVVASSMSIYGEGMYRTRDGKICCGFERSHEQLRNGEWELRGSDGDALLPIPTPESKPPQLSSIYALSKYDQEHMCLMIGQAYGVPTVAVRFFNVYGPNQALSNPYTGVLAIFASRLLNRKAPLIFEDGRQRRDFVSVCDVKRACRMALLAPEAPGRVFNIGSGQSYSIEEIARRMARVMGHASIEPQIMGQYRAGDIRHCFADITAARTTLGYEPRTNLDEGISQLAAWLEGKPAIDRVIEAVGELASRGLTI
jgi:dTDP-L-rhamnose 4-epimerase